jgi:HSP20 family protein
MLLASIDPFVQEFDQLAQRVFGWGDVSRGQVRAAMPMDAIRRKDEVVLRFDLPGIDPASIDLTVDRGVLTVSAERLADYGEGEKPFIRERVFGTFSRRVYLADTLDADKIEAAYHDGVLAVRVPLLERAMPRKIEVHTANGKKAIKN